MVGPNGSGKSNVIDAMLFVFGRRAKQLRFNKVSELIHNSTHHRNLERACVTVHFQEIVDRVRRGVVADASTGGPLAGAASCMGLRCSCQWCSSSSISTMSSIAGVAQQLRV